MGDLVLFLFQQTPHKEKSHILLHEVRFILSGAESSGFTESGLAITIKYQAGHEI
jgi:hypothetical protein